jgi:hypothetical protein
MLPYAIAPPVVANHANQRPQSSQAATFAPTSTSNGSKRSRPTQPTETSESLVRVVPRATQPIGGRTWCLAPRSVVSSSLVVGDNAHRSAFQLINTVLDFRQFLFAQLLAAVSYIQHMATTNVFKARRPSPLLAFTCIQTQPNLNAIQPKRNLLIQSIQFY